MTVIRNNITPNDEIMDMKELFDYDASQCPLDYIFANCQITINDQAQNETYEVDYFPPFAIIGNRLRITSSKVWQQGEEFFSQNVSGFKFNESMTVKINNCAGGSSDTF